MATNDTVQARVSPELKAEAEALFSSMGLKTSDAIRLFLQQTVNSGGLPFQPKAKIPNADTLAAIKEVENGEGTRYSSAQAMFDDLGD
jgi:DNA-damage-inducible protein J